MLYILGAWTNIQSIFNAIKVLSILFINPPSSLSTGKRYFFFFTASIVLSFPKCYVVRIIQYVASSYCCFHLVTCILFSMYFHGLRDHFFSMLNNIPLYRCTKFIYLIPIIAHFVGFQVLAIITKDAVNIHE